MNFDTPLAIFQHLLAIDEDNMAINLPTLIDEKHEFYLEVMSLISAHEENKKQTSFSGLINQQAEQLVEDNVIHKLINTQVGVYKLTKKLGQGGMGAVYLGERNDGQLEQKVAIKFVYPSIAALAGDDFLQKEAQHLANLDHVNIAKIFTVDKTEENLPYMVMEYVDGIPIDQYSNKNSLGVKERLKLLKKICSAVQIAHQNMIIHADIKPSNILVDNQGEPKLMDFGIAKNLNSTISTSDQCLKAASRDYASPEQLASSAITTLCDIYSIGQLLARLLPVKNSELNSLISKASHQNLHERYQTISQIYDDITAFNEMRPLKAHSSPLYSFKKFISRNAIGSALTSVLIIGSLFFYIQIVKKNNELEKEQLISNHISEFLINSFDAANPEIASKEQFLALDVLKLAEKNLKAVNDLPLEAQGKVLTAFASAYSGAGEYNRAIEIFNTVIHYPNQDTPNINLEISNALMQSSKFSEALSFVDKVLENIDSSSLYYAQAIAQKGAIYMFLDKNDEALSLLLKALPLINKSSDNLHSDIPVIHNQIANIYTNKGDYQKVLEHSKKAYDAAEKIYGKSTPQMSNAILSMAHAYSILEDFEKNAEFTKKALEIDKKVYGEEHDRIIIISNNLGNAYSRLGRYDDAVRLHQEALTLTVKKFGTKHIDYAYSNAYLANALEDMGQYEEAIKANTQAYQSYLELFGAKHQVTIMAKSNLGLSYLENGDNTNAERILLETHDEAIVFFQEGHPRLAMVQANVAKLFLKLNRLSDALKISEIALVTFREHFDEDSQRVQGILSTISEIKSQVQ